MTTGCCWVLAYVHRLLPKPTLPILSYPSATTNFCSFIKIHLILLIDKIKKMKIKRKMKCQAVTSPIDHLQHVSLLPFTSWLDIIYNSHAMLKKDWTFKKKNKKLHHSTCDGTICWGRALPTQLNVFNIIFWTIKVQRSLLISRTNSIGVAYLVSQKGRNLCHEPVCLPCCHHFICTASISQVHFDMKIYCTWQMGNWIIKMSINENTAFNCGTIGYGHGQGILLAQRSTQ